MAAYVDLDASAPRPASASSPPRRFSPPPFRPPRWSRSPRSRSPVPRAPRSPPPSISPVPLRPRPRRALQSARSVSPPRRRRRRYSPSPSLSPPSPPSRRPPPRSRYRSLSRDRDPYRRDRDRDRDRFDRRERPRSRSWSDRSYSPVGGGGRPIDGATRKQRRKGRRGRADERRRRDRDRNRNVSPASRLSDQVVAELFLVSLKQVLKDRRPPFNISVVSDYMARNNRDWAVWKSSYSTFSELCRVMEAEGHLVVARKGESVVVGSSKYDFEEGVQRPRKRRRRDAERGERDPQLVDRDRYRHSQEPDRDYRADRAYDRDRYDRDRYDDRVRYDRYPRERDQTDYPPRAERDRYDRESYERGERRERGHDTRDRGERSRVERDRGDLDRMHRNPDGASRHRSRPGPVEDKAGSGRKAMDAAASAAPMPAVDEAKGNEQEAETTLRLSTASAAGSSNKELVDEGMLGSARQGETERNMVEDGKSKPSEDGVEPRRSADMERMVEDNREKQYPGAGLPPTTDGMESSHGVAVDIPRRDVNDTPRSGEVENVASIGGKAPMEHLAPSESLVGSTARDDRNDAGEDLDRHSDPSMMEPTGNTQQPDDLGQPQDLVTGKQMVAEVEENAELGLDGPQF